MRSRHALNGVTRRLMRAGLASGLLLQFGGCDFGQITTTQTLDARDAVIQIVRGIILTPIDAAITNAVNAAFDADDD